MQRRAVNGRRCVVGGDAFGEAAAVLLRAGFEFAGGWLLPSRGRRRLQSRSAGQWSEGSCVFFFGVLCVRRGGDLYERGAGPLVGGLLLPCGCDQEKAKINSGEPNQGAP